MRISGGQARGIKLKIPKYDNIRPATEANRERLFSSLRDRIINSSFLDLFAGTGSYGLESLSRGALEGTFVEKNIKAETCLKSNLINVCKSAKIDENSAVIKIRDVVEFLKNDKKSYNIIFLDPPYHLFSKLSKTIFETIRKNKILNKKGILIHEGSPEMLEKFDGWEITKKIGKNKKGAPQFRLFMLTH